MRPVSKLCSRTKSLSHLRDGEVVLQLRKTLNRLLATLTVCLTLLSVFVSAHLPSAHASSPGKNFDNIAVIAMENQPYSTLSGHGTNDANCPLTILCRLLPYTAPILHDNGTGRGTHPGCS